MRTVQRPPAGSRSSASPRASAEKFITTTTSSPGPCSSQRRKAIVFAPSSQCSTSQPWPHSPRVSPPRLQPRADQVAVQAHDAAELVALVPVQRHVVAEPFALQELLALEDHRDARRREHQRRGQRRALLRDPAGRVVGVRSPAARAPCRWRPRRATRCRRRAGTRRRCSGGDRVARPRPSTGARRRRTITASRTGWTNARPTARGSRRRRRRASRSSPSSWRRSSAMVIALRVAFADLAVDPLHQRPAVVDVVAAVAGDRADVQRHVEAQAVDVELVEPHQRVVADELAHLAAAVVGPGVAPRRRRLVVVVEVDAALVVLAPAVESPEVEVARAEVVVDDVEDDADAALVRLADEAP